MPNSRKRRSKKVSMAMSIGKRNVAGGVELPVSAELSQAAQALLHPGFCLNAATPELPTALPSTVVVKPHFCIEHERCTVNPRKLEHGFRRISARIPNTLP